MGAGGGSGSAGGITTSTAGAASGGWGWFGLCDANQGASRVSGASWLLLVPLSLRIEVSGCHPGL